MALNPKTAMWWESRRPGELTPIYLGRVLDELGLHDMARRAREGHYDDFAAPDDVADGFEMLRLGRSLVAEARAMQLSGQRERRARTLAVLAAVKAGEFDATQDEADRWAASKAGQEALGDAEAMRLAEAVVAKAKTMTPEEWAAVEKTASRAIGEDDHDA